MFCNEEYNAACFLYIESAFASDEKKKEKKNLIPLATNSIYNVLSVFDK